MSPQPCYGRNNRPYAARRQERKEVWCKEIVTAVATTHTQPVAP